MGHTRKQYKGSYTNEQFSENILNGFYSTKGYEFGTITAINGLSNAYGITGKEVRGSIGKYLAQKKNEGIKVKDIAQEFGIASSTVYSYLNIAKDSGIEAREKKPYESTRKSVEVAKHVKPRGEVLIGVPREVKINPLERDVQREVERVRPNISGWARLQNNFGGGLLRVWNYVALGAALVGAGLFGKYIGNIQGQNNQLNADLKTIELVMQHENKKCECICAPKPKPLYAPKPTEKKHIQTEKEKTSGNPQKPTGQIPQSQEKKYSINTDWQERFSFMPYRFVPKKTVSQETNYNCGAQEIRQDTELVQSYNQQDLANMLSTECKDPYKREPGVRLGDFIINASEILRTSKHRTTARYNSLEEIAHEGKNIFGDTQVIQVYRLHGATEYVMPYNLNGDCRPKGAWELTTSLNGKEIVTESDFWNDFTTRNVHVKEPTGTSSFDQFGQDIRDAKEREKPIIIQHVVGDENQIDGFIIQGQYRATDGITDLPYRVKVQNPYYDKNDKAANGAVLLGMGEAAAIAIGANNIGGGNGGGSIAPGRAGGENMIRAGGALIAQ